VPGDDKDQPKLTLTGPTEPMPVNTAQIVSAKCTCGEDEFVFKMVSGPPSGEARQDGAQQAVVDCGVAGDIVVEGADSNGHVGQTTVKFFSFPADVK